MNFRFHSRIRSGLVALGVLAGLCVPAAATPLTGVSRAAVAPAIADTPSDVLNVNHRRYRCYDGRCGQKYGRSQLRYKYWNGNSYRNGNNYWNGDDWRYRKYRRHYRRHLYAQPYFYFNAPTYRYVQPRRYYRGGLGSAHVAWCYDRYRSYRQWDNTFQPYHGPRQQCWSPYS